jgi:tetratricopeptide (TPR) repeat protein
VFEGLKAVMNLTTEIPARVVIDILRQAGKASVLRRQFPKAEILLREALLRARDVYGENHLKYADCLVDYAFYLLNVDGVVKSVQAYEKALTVREKILGKENLLVARAYEELAYATYVNEYNSGQFKTAKFYADTSLTIMQKIIPSNHLLMASSQRVLALILEEIAIDLNDKKQSTEMLNQAEQLHLSAVSLSSSAFGEMNVQTAKHYGNLGRLYQTMEKFDQAEQMHLKAIHIKETLLGKDDYEVALSIGHLASLYNYDLEEFIKAEELYLRSIAISLRLFGPAYSGLEYDYRGLVRVYELSTDWENVYKYISKLADWKDLRRAKETDSNHELFYTTTTARIPLTKILQSLNTSSTNSSYSKSSENSSPSSMLNST